MDLLWRLLNLSLEWLVPQLFLFFEHVRKTASIFAFVFEERQNSQLLVEGQPVSEPQKTVYRLTHVPGVSSFIQPLANKRFDLSGRHWLIPAEKSPIE